MQFRFAIIGAGNIAAKFADAVSRLDGCEVAAVASKSQARAEAFAASNGIAAAYDSYERMLKTERPDCAYIATTSDSHPALSELCVQCRVPVLCEKAMFSDERQAGAFFTLAEREGVFTMEALWSRFLPANLKAREWIRSGRIGALVSADFEIGFNPPRDWGNRYFNPALGGGAANDLTVYALHLLPWVTDRGIEAGRVGVVAAPTGVDETEAVLLTLSGGLPATARTTLASRVEERMVICGREGRIVVPKPHMAQSAVLYDGEGGLAERFEDAQTQNGFVYEVDEAMRCIRMGRMESEAVPHSATVQAAKYIRQIHEALGR